MTPKTLGGMALATVLLTVAATTLDTRRDARAAWSKADEPLFPSLADAAQEAARLRIEGAEGVTTVERTGDEWTVAERGGYAGRADEVGRLLMALTDARRLEPKTEDPAKYEKLGLAGFEDEASPTVRLTVEDDGGGAIADVFIGNRNYRGGGESWYVRKPEEERIWSVEAKLRTPKRTTEWLDTELFDVARDRIAEVRVEHAEGEPVHLVRPEPDAPAFDVANLPEGREPKSDRSGAAFLGSLASLRLQDVRPAAEAGFPEPPPTTTTWWTSDGLRVDAELAEVGEEEAKELLCRLSFAFDEERAPAPEMGPDPPAGDEETGDDGADPEEEVDPFAPEEPEPKTREEVEAEVAELSALVDGWVFVLPTWKKTSFVIEMEELLEPLPEPEEDAEETAPDELPTGEGEEAAAGDESGGDPPADPPAGDEGGGGR